MRKLLAWLLMMAPVAASATNTVAQNTTVCTYANTTTASCTFGSTMTNPSLIVVILTEDTVGSTPTISDNKNAGNYALDSNIHTGATQTGGVIIASKQNTQTAAATITATFTSSYGRLKIFEITGAATSSAFDVQNTAAATASPVSIAITTSQADDSVFAGVVSIPNTSTAADSGYSSAYTSVAVQNLYHYAEYRADAGAAGAITLTTGQSGNRSWMMAVASYKTASSTGILGGSVLLNFP